MICFNCGKKIAQNSTLCEYCGANQTTHIATLKEIEKTKMLANKRNNVRSMFNFLMGFFLTLGILFTIISFATVNGVKITLLIFALVCLLLFFVSLTIKHIMLRKIEHKKF